MRVKYFVWLSLMLPLAPAISLGRAQNATAPRTIGGFEVYNKPTVRFRSNGVRLDGAGGLPAGVRSLQIDLSAQVLAIDYTQDADTQKKAITQMRAKTGVKLLLNLPAGGAKSEAVRLEAQADDMVFNPVLSQGRRSLVLTGDVDGFYEVGGARNTLHGNQVTISFGAQPSRDLRAEVEGGNDGVRLEVAGQNFGGEAGQMGNIVLTAQRASVDQTQGQARLIGKARAVSSGGVNAFDVAASEFVVKLGGAARSLDSLQTVGRAQIKISLPPARVDKTTPANTSTNDATAVRPTYVEVAADHATIVAASQTLTLDGNVQGFYRLVEGAKATLPAADAPKGMAGDYKFSGSRAILRMVPEKEATVENPAGPNLDISSVSMQLPGLDLGFGEEADQKKNANGRH